MVGSDDEGQENQGDFNNKSATADNSAVSTNAANDNAYKRPTIVSHLIIYTEKG